MDAFATPNSARRDAMRSEGSSPRVEITHHHHVFKVDVGLLQRAVFAVCHAEQIPSAEISIVLTDDAESQRINREFLSHDYPTDVISFPLSDDPDPRDGNSGARAQLQGELVISLDTAHAVASAQGWSLDAEVVLYVVHGLLHLCGYDDHAEEARLIMRKREREIVSALKLPDGLDPTRSGWDSHPA